jgi:hypothetical protein
VSNANGLLRPKATAMEQHVPAAAAIHPDRGNGGRLPVAASAWLRGLNLTHKIEHFPIVVEGVEFL